MIIKTGKNNRYKTSTQHKTQLHKTTTRPPPNPTNEDGKTPTIAKTLILTLGKQNRLRKTARQQNTLRKTGREQNTLIKIRRQEYTPSKTVRQQNPLSKTGRQQNKVSKMRETPKKRQEVTRSADERWQHTHHLEPHVMASSHLLKSLMSRRLAGVDMTVCAGGSTLPAWTPLTRRGGPPYTLKPKRCTAEARSRVFLSQWL